MASTPSAPAELENEFAWSWSRHKMFYECTRQTYWQYYGSWKGWLADAPPEAALAYRLKQVRSVPMLLGDEVHAVLAERLRLRPDGPSDVPVPQIQAEVERRVLKRMRESHNRDWERLGDVKHHAILFEDYYGPGLQERDKEAALDAIRSCAEGLLSSRYVRRAFATPKQRLRIVDPERFDAMKISIDDVLVYGAPDLVVEDAEGIMHVVDWKTGHPNKTDVAQLAVYGLYVSEKLGTPLERIVAHVVYLRTGDVERFDHLRQGVEEARRRIATYTADVRSRLTDRAKNVAADVDLFPMTDDLRKCKRCKFQELCGRTATNPEAPEDEESM